MSHDFDYDDDPAAATVFLAAEAAVLAERVRVLRGQLADVGARIQETAEKLHGLPAAPAAYREEHGSHHSITAPDGIQDSDDRRQPKQPNRAAPCRP